MSVSLNPFKYIRKQELSLSLLMFSYFFLVITSFWVLKPIKKALFIEYYDQSGVDLWGWMLTASQAELVAKILNMVVAFGAVIVFTMLSRKLHRQQLTNVFSLFIIVCLAGFSRWLLQPEDLTVWSFYLFGDLFSTLMVATFFAFLNDSMTPDSAKRLYGIIGLGGVAGGVFGSTFVTIWVSSVSREVWMWVCIGLVVLIMIVATAAGRIAKRNEDLLSNEREVSKETETKKEANAAIEGARLVFGSPYLLSIVAIVFCYEIVSTILDFQFTSTIAHYLDGEAIGQQISLVFSITNGASLIIQLFFTSYVMTRFGLVTALMVLPAAIALGSSAFLVMPLLWVGSMLNTLDNAPAYSINQSAKESLYVPTSRDEKYKAKAFIDMFVQRFAKAVAVVMSLAITTWFADFSTIRYLSIVVLLLLGVWILAAVYAGRQFRARSLETLKPRVESEGED
ncbi:NTP/NDP exchange transporter [Thiolapillus sp.]